MYRKFPLIICLGSFVCLGMMESCSLHTPPFFVTIKHPALALESVQVYVLERE